MIASARVPKALGFLMVSSGLAYLVQGLALGSGGFTATNTTAILADYALTLTWTTWLALIAWRAPRHANHPGSRSVPDSSVAGH